MKSRVALTFACLLCFAILVLRIEQRPPAAATEPAAESVVADLILTNGKIWTVCADRPEAAAVAVWRDRILAVGTRAEINRLAGPKTHVIDLQGQRVVPGFFDSHLHLLAGGLDLKRVNLKDAKDEAAFGELLRKFDKELPRDRWLLGGNWDHDRTFKKGELPTAEMLDKYVSPERHVFLYRYDGHMAVVNSRVLRLAKIDANTPDPVGGTIDRKPNSKEPTGVLREKAINLASRHEPETGDDELVEAVQAALKEIAANGVTSVQDMDGSEPADRRRLLRLYQQLARTGRLSARIDLRWRLSEWQQPADLGIEAGFGDDWVRIGGVKGFADGSLGSSTAMMFEPFLTGKDNREWVTQPGKLREYILGADKAGLQVAIHAIGDQANAELLDIFAEVIEKNGSRDRRFRIEHAQHLRPQDYPRFKELGVIPSMQPYHIIDDGRWAEERIGAKRCASSYANRSLLDADAVLAFGSDWSVAPISPLLGIDAAVHRRTLDGKNPNGWFPEQRIRVPEAIKAYTLDAAYAAFQEKDRGSIEAGKLADFVVLSRDILAEGERDHIAETEIVMTIVGGRTVYARKAGR